MVKCPYCGFLQRHHKAPRASVEIVLGADSADNPPPDLLQNPKVLDYTEIESALLESGIEKATLTGDEGWRLLSGSILAISGLAGLAKGSVDLLFFDEYLRILIQGHNRFLAVPFSDLTGLQFAGRGRHSASSKFQVVGGGFGLEGAAKGIGEALVFNSVIQALTSREVIESVIQITWTTGSLTLSNEEHTPEQIAHSLSAVVSELNRKIYLVEDEPVTGNAYAHISGELRELTQLWRDGALSDEEFTAAKAKVIQQPPP